ncbi:hypothetical protein MIB92_19170 [Aestuariirhabdus sp. Z084]|uniref:5'-3' exonuclease H3TH domain-containing protein n=1 Tax=Aestuariirhabdus haliotis TaxID=2918751 RepID=UPI00201B4054|nr:5'-3' exonuclease H3TH domain-containing protein [Aestuariirhabdus haliotis]MCL6417788.1 hypothetical protein [Aestuariirhabdus haliotis]MCL6420211.1 hypothetical protein [Aestuariirhabdus haliotis]
MEHAVAPEVKLLLIDGMNLVRRIYGAQQSVDKLEETLLASLRRAVREYQATHLIMVMDGSGPTWRHQLYADYKLGRKPMPEDLQRFMPALLEWLVHQGVALIDQPSTEADDIITALVIRLQGLAVKIRVLSTDKGFLPLINEQVSVRDHFRSFDWNHQAIRERFGVSPGLLRDYWALCGDSSNHIPGVDGVGPKRASELINHYGSLRNVLAEAEQMPGRIGELLRAQHQQADLSRRLLEPKVDFPLTGNLQNYRIDPRLCT